MPDGTEFSNRSKRGSNHARKREERTRARAGRPTFDIMELEGRAFWLCLEQVVAKEGALRLGLSRDGGALAVGVYGDGEPYTEYVRPGESIDEYFAGLAEHFANLGD